MNRKGKKQEPVVEVDTKDLLHPDYFRPFWLSWTDGNVRVGKGHDVGQNTFIDYSDASPIHINYIGVAGDINPGVFLIDVGQS